MIEYNEAINLLTKHDFLRLNTKIAEHIIENLGGQDLFVPLEEFIKIMNQIWVDYSRLN